MVWQLYETAVISLITQKDERMDSVTSAALIIILTY